MNEQDLKNNGFTKFIDYSNEKTIFIKRFKWSKYQLEVDSDGSKIKLLFDNPEQSNPEEVFECSNEGFDQINEAMEGIESELKTMYSKANKAFKIIASKEFVDLINVLK